ncbi:hypothetical protein BDQ17DRAFT_1374892 [Cyathus striatus]|nr:hypothetical protein BDQ17DRAFT_1374892 [Cyathus striatus]
MYATRMQDLELSLPQSHHVRGTKYDSIPSIDKLRRVLWNVIEVMNGIVGALADSDIAERKGGEAVFFDVLSISLVIQLRTFLTTNIVLLTLRPLLLLLLAAMKHFAKDKDRVDPDASSHHHRDYHRDSRLVLPTRRDRECSTRAEIRKRVIRKLNIAWMRVKFLVAVVSAMGALKVHWGCWWWGLIRRIHAQTMHHQFSLSFLPAPPASSTSPSYFASYPAVAEKQ